MLIGQAYCILLSLRVLLMVIFFIFHSCMSSWIGCVIKYELLVWLFILLIISFFFSCLNHLFNVFTCLLFYLSMSLPVHIPPSVNPSTCLHLYLYLSTCLSVYLFTRTIRQIHLEVTPLIISLSTFTTIDFRPFFPLYFFVAANVSRFFLL